MKNLYFLSSFFCLMIIISCSNDDGNNSPEPVSDPNALQIEEQDISHTLVNLKWGTVATTENNTNVIYDIVLEGNKVKENNTDTDYTLTRLKNNTTYTGEIIARSVLKTSENKNAKVGVLKKIPFKMTTKQYRNSNAPEPSVFSINVESVSTTTVTLKWDESTITDNSQITYDIYIDGDKEKNNLTERTIIINGLEKNTNYTGAIIAISNNEKSKLIPFSFKTPEVDIANIDITEIKITPTTLSVTVGDTNQLIATVLPENASNKNVTWISSDTNIATVDVDGNVTAVVEGTVSITATSVENDQISSTSTITVETDAIELTKITITSPTVSIVIGDTKKLQISFTPYNASNKNVSWLSSDTNIATVDDNGNVTAIAEGNVTITVTADENSSISDTSEFTILTQAIPVTDLDIITTIPNDIYESETINLNKTILPQNATNKDVIWNSSDLNLATVSSTGNVRFLKPGTVIISVTSLDNDQITDSRTLTILPSPISFDPVTGLYKAPPGSKVTFSGDMGIGGPLNSGILLELFASTESNISGNILFTETLQFNVYSPNLGPNDLDPHPIIVSQPFTMPANGEVYISGGWFELDPQNPFTSFYSFLFIDNDQGPSIQYDLYP